ncbi:hypothetical protein OU798_03440 [Prolixibacteraceae bacterium Z1-6]|uniref:beta-galactosidase n=1 Tax=Draconibacterium aestuarii TaxID=2998507 RepID=A0A9X3FB98_9BACT|nr:hypothetical protein [Prolixibacteraceae bacterium Z1-6]
MKVFKCLTIIGILLASFACNSRNNVLTKIWVKDVKTPVVSLNGTWQFSMDEKNWSDVQVPGELQMQGFAIKHDKTYTYKTTFTVPSDYSGKQIGINFYGVYSYARCWVNGTYVRDHSGGFTKWTCDITELVRPGEEVELKVEVCDKTNDISYASGYAKHQIGGILRDVELTALPKQNFKLLYFETELDKSYQNADLKVFYELKQDSPSKIKIDLFSKDGKLVKSLEQETSSKSGQFQIQVENPEKWDAEHPNLYTLVTILFDGKEEILKKSEDIGFREVKIDGNKLLVNGKPVKLRGACRHDVHPTLGRMSTPEYDLQDVLLAKEANINFIRTSHYPPSEKFLEYCDRYGLYVEDESAVCFVATNRSGEYNSIDATRSDPEWTQYLSQCEEMVQNHRNHACIIIWSIGNENRFGDNFQKSYNWVKKNDKTRPVIFSYPQYVPDGAQAFDIFSSHYPDWRGTNARYKEVTIKGFEYPGMPAIFDEWAHVACYNKFELREDPNVRSFWAHTLDSMWTNIFEVEGGLGGAIWCFLDETFMLPKETVGYGEWGIVDTWRRRKPEFWATKKSYSPTKIYTKVVQDFLPNDKLIIPVHNRFDHTNFSELKIVWKYGEQTGELEQVNLEPHKKGQLVFPPAHWNFDEKLNIKFYSNDTILVDEYNLQLGEKKVELPVCSKGKLNVNETDSVVFIAGERFKLKLNKNTGLIEDLKVNNELLLKSGPYINLKFPGEKNQGTNFRIDDYAKNWKQSSFKFEVNDGIATLHTTGTYDKISAGFTVQIDENGLLDIRYKISDAPTDIYIQEVGIKFYTGESFNKMDWDRNAYFTVYPENDLGAAKGEVLLSEKTKMNYREKPEHNWAFDPTSFYYFGQEEKPSYTNIVRSLKENIYSWSLSVSNSTVKVFSDGSQACRFDKIDGINTIIINDLWDYNSLLWNNYQKRIKLKGTPEGRIILLCD